MNRLRMEHRASVASAERELERVVKIINAIKDGFAGPELKAEMDDLQARKESLGRAVGRGRCAGPERAQNRTEWESRRDALGGSKCEEAIRSVMRRSPNRLRARIRASQPI
jgi:hypothetical protein